VPVFLFGFLIGRWLWYALVWKLDRFLDGTRYCPSLSTRCYMTRLIPSSLLVISACLSPSVALAERIQHSIIADFAISAAWSEHERSYWGGKLQHDRTYAHLNGSMSFPRVDKSQFILHSVTASFELSAFGYSYTSGSANHSTALLFRLEESSAANTGLVFHSYINTFVVQHGPNGGGGGTTYLVDEHSPSRQVGYPPTPLQTYDFDYDPAVDPQRAMFELSYTSFASGGFSGLGTPENSAVFTAAGLYGPTLTIEYELERIPGTSGPLPSSFSPSTEFIGKVARTDNPPGVEGWEIPDFLQFAGDYNESLTVDQADYLTWASEYGSTSDALTADGNRDGVVDAADYTLWRDNLGGGLEVLQSNVAAGSNVPEPSAIAVLLCAALSCARVARIVERR
jgi:hypothetical protein